MSGCGSPLGCGPNTTGPASVVPYALVTDACGRAARIASIRLWLTGAEPMRMDSTLVRSAAASASRSRSIMAIIGGTAVSQVQR